MAVKVLKADSLNQPGVFEDFIKEVQAMHCLSHQNLVRWELSNGSHREPLPVLPLCPLRLDKSDFVVGYTAWCCRSP